MKQDQPVTQDTLKPCRACGAECRIERFEPSDHLQLPVDVWVCPHNVLFGGGCPDTLGYLSAEAWNDRPDQLAAKDTEIARLRDALEFYADRDGDGYQVDVTNYGLSTEEGEIVRDGGKRARTALQSIIDVEASLDSGRGQTFSPEQGGE